MADTIDVHDLDDDDLEIVKAIVEKMRERVKRKRATQKGRKQGQGDEEFVFGSRRSRVIGNLTREEIYEDR